MLYIDPYRGKGLTLSAKLEKEAEYMNRETYWFWYTYLMELALNRYEWHGLPPEIDSRFIELCMLFNGSVLFYFDDMLGEYLALEYSAIGPESVNRDPIRRMGISYGYAHNERTGKYEIIKYRDLNPKNSVIIWNNSTRTPDIGAVHFYAQKLTEIDRAHDVNLRQQKTSKIIKTTSDTQMTMENLLRKHDGNVPFIFGGKIIDPTTDIYTIDTSTPFLLDKLSLEHKTMLARAHTFFGVENSSTDKKERQVTDEVISNLGGVAFRRYVGLKPRLDGCKKIERIFPLLPTVEFSQDDIMSLIAPRDESNMGEV